VEAYVTLNGRSSRLMVDPEFDLGTAEDNYENKEWILPYDRSKK
jgi:hypothetical protein